MRPRNIALILSCVLLAEPALPCSGEPELRGRTFPEDGEVGVPRNTGIVIMVDGWYPPYAAQVDIGVFDDDDAQVTTGEFVYLEDRLAFVKFGALLDPLAKYRVEFAGVPVGGTGAPGQWREPITFTTGEALDEEPPTVEGFTATFRRLDEMPFWDNDCEAPLGGDPTLRDVVFTLEGFDPSPSEDLVFILWRERATGWSLVNFRTTFNGGLTNAPELHLQLDENYDVGTVRLEVHDTAGNAWDTGPIAPQRDDWTFVDLASPDAGMGESVDAGPDADDGGPEQGPMPSSDAGSAQVNEWFGCVSSPLGGEPVMLLTFLALARLRGSRKWASHQN